MSSERRKILDMLAEGKITADEAERLLGLVDRGAESGPSGASEAKTNDDGSPYRYLRVRVEPNPEAEEAGDGERVNIRVPLALLKAGMKLGSLIPQQASNSVKDALSRKGIDFDVRNITDEQIAELIGALSDLEIDVQDKEHYVRIGVE
ncbi:MAG: hypothetical protein HQ548_05205 [Chloroflexi bacterium]|nr:hypothetical protein [Chloroflexota bacterium]